MKTSIIVSVFNCLEWTECCLDSILLNTDLNKNELILINNGSNKKVGNFLNKFKNNNINVKLLEFEKNIGSYASWNRGIKISEGKYVCILHNDCIVSNSWLEKMMVFIENFSDDYYQIGCVSPVTNYSDEWEFLYNKEFLEFYVKNKLPNKDEITKYDILDILRKTYPNGIEDFEKNMVFRDLKNYEFTESIGNFCFLFTREIYNQYGPFDEDFFPHRYSEKIFKYNMSIDARMSVLLRDVYIHHNGNTTSDGKFFNIHLVEKKNRKLFENKMLGLFSSYIKNDIFFEKYSQW